MTTDLSIPLREISEQVQRAFRQSPMPDPGDTLKRQWFDIIDDVGTSHGRTPRVNFFPGFRVLGGRLYVAGKQRCIACAPPDHGPQLARYMDMAGLYFWKYRQRNIRPAVDSDFIFSLAQATADLAEQTAFVEFLKHTEELFLEHNLFPAPRQEGDKKPDKRTLTHAVNYATSLVRRDVKEMREETALVIESLTREVKSLTRQLGEMAKRLPVAVTVTEEGRQALLNHAAPEPVTTSAVQRSQSGLL